MDAERLVRTVEERLSHLGDPQRAEVIDALREAIALERRWTQNALTVESERERRQQAETLRAGLEGIVRQARLEETIDEVIRQIARIVSFDSCSLALLESEGEFRIVAARGFTEPGKVIGLRYRDRLSEEIRETHQAVSIANAQTDERYAAVEDSTPVRSWAGVPLVVEGELIGLLSLDRHAVDPFLDEEIHRAKALAFSAAAAIKNARLLESVERYAGLMERLVSLHRDVLEGREPDEIGRAILEGAVRLGYPGGLLVMGDGAGARIAAAAGDAFEAAAGRPAPSELLSEAARRLDGAQARQVAATLGLTLAEEPLYLVPLATEEAQLGTLVLHDPAGESASGDALTQAYASRAAPALAYAGRRR